MKYVIIGTAGHVDHGKTVLIGALTGEDTDRLKEEKNRGISIELGFASAQLGDEVTAAFVDVPGHEKFIRQMIAGAGSMKMVLLTVAADEGIMPQTKEHIDIIDLLDIRTGVAAVTKKDLVTQEELNNVCEDVKSFLDEKGLGNWPIIPVSAQNGEGIDELKTNLSRTIKEAPALKASDKMRMPIDRVFSLKGVGTVVTGTLWSGSVKNDDELEIMPQQYTARVRRVQVHGEEVEKAAAGYRAALNLVGPDKEMIKRGNVLQTPGLLELTNRIDVLFKLLPEVKKPLKHWQRIRFYHGTQELFGRVSLLGCNEVKPGDQVYIQILLEDNLAAASFDKFVARLYSPLQTIGGGVIINTAAPKRKRFEERNINNIHMLYTGSSDDKLEVILSEFPKKIFSGIDLEVKLMLTPEELIECADRNENIKKLEGGDKENFYISRLEYMKLSNVIKKELGQYHKNYPLRKGMPKEEIRSSIFSSYTQKEFSMLLHQMGKDEILIVEKDAVRLASFKAEPNEKLDKKISLVEDKLLENPFKPSRWSNISKELFYFKPKEGDELLKYLLKTGRIVKIADDLFFHIDAVEKAKALLKEYLEQHDSITVSEARDVLGSSRKYVVPLLEYLDKEKFTRRIEDERVLAEKNRK